MDKYEILTSSIMNRSYIRFPSISSFYKWTREDRIEKLAGDLFANVHPKMEFSKENREYISWINSLPDLATLLATPERYHQDMLRDKQTYDETIDALLSDMKELAGEKISTARFLSEQTIDHFKTMLIEYIDRSFAGYKEKVKTDKKSSLSLESGIDVTLEFPVNKSNGTTGRCDVILHRKDRKNTDNYLIIELKQITEGFNPKKKSKPWLQVAEYMKQLEILEPDANVNGLVYLHNQMYYDGEMFQAFEEAKQNKEIPDSIQMYSRTFCGSMITRINRLL